MGITIKGVAVCGRCARTAECVLELRDQGQLLPVRVPDEPGWGYVREDGKYLEVYCPRHLPRDSFPLRS